MSSVKSLLFSHNHHLLSVKGCEAGLDVLAFEGDEALSSRSAIVSNSPAQTMPSEKR